MCSASGQEIDLAEAGTDVIAVESRFFHRVFFIFASLAVVSLFVSFAGSAIGSRLSMGGHTDDNQIHEVVIGNDVVVMPANRIRYPEQRRDGIAGRLDIYAMWPSLQGFSEEYRSAFNDNDRSRPLIYISFEPRSLSRDMSGRLDPIYSQVFDGPGEPLPNGLVRYLLRKEAGFVDESILVGDLDDGTKFVARCLTPNSQIDSIAACNRDIHLGDDLAMMVRFPLSLLDEWKSLNMALSTFAMETVKTPAP